MFSGYKTYFVAALAVIGAVFGYLDGDLMLGAAVQMAVTAVLAVTLRSGMKS